MSGIIKNQYAVGSWCEKDWVYKTTRFSCSMSSFWQPGNTVDELHLWFELVYVCVCVNMCACMCVEETFCVHDHASHMCVHVCLFQRSEEFTPAPLSFGGLKQSATQQDVGSEVIHIFWLGFLPRVGLLWGIHGPPLSLTLGPGGDSTKLGSLAVRLRQPHFVQQNTE